MYNKNHTAEWGIAVSMSKTNWDRKNYLQLIAAVILVVGLASAVMIYFAAVKAEGNDMYDPYMSKSYRHSIRLYGGKMTLLANDLHYWFLSLWEGEQLAYTIGWGSVLISGGLFWIARHMRSERKGSGQPPPED